MSICWCSFGFHKCHTYIELAVPCVFWETRSTREFTFLKISLCKIIFSLLKCSGWLSFWVGKERIGAYLVENTIELIFLGLLSSFVSKIRWTKPLIACCSLRRFRIVLAVWSELTFFKVLLEIKFLIAIFIILA